jgi:hypothetical protein
VSTDVSVPPLPKALRIFLGPLTLLERTRGRKRTALIAAYVMGTLLAGLFVWRAASLRDLPDIGDPFDVKQVAHIDLGDSDNAFVLYREATERFKAPSAQVNLNVSDWTKATPEARRSAEDNAAALELVRQASERPKALYHQPGDLVFSTRIDVVQDLRPLCRLALLEGSRRESQGDWDGAWVCYRSVLRTSRHVGSHGVLVQGLIGVALLSMSTERVFAWADNPNVRATALRRALAEVKECEALSTPVSEMIKVEYLSLTKEILTHRRKLLDEVFESDTTWYHHHTLWRDGGLYLRREPERGMRVIPLVFANWLAHCDEPASRRPAFSKTEPRMFVGTESASAGLSPEALERWCRSTSLVGLYLPAVPNVIPAMDRERRTFAALKLTLAEQLYRREHGGYPHNLGELVGPYLDQLPDGFSAGDPPTTAPAQPAESPSKP